MTNKLINILNQTEGRRLEFKESLPLKSDLSKQLLLLPTMPVVKSMLASKINLVKLLV
jgi:hypothetical protein